MKQFPVQLDDVTRRMIAELAEWWGFPPTRHITAVIRRLVAEAHARESARCELAAHDAAMNELHERK